MGLFHRHAGTKKNTPVVRTGNIAAMPEEPVDTARGPMEAYLVEARSIGGLSGSPVFVHLGIVRNVEGQVKFATQKWGVFYLLGMMQGHWEMPLLDVDFANEDERGLVTANMGIAVVSPADRILEVLNQPFYLALRLISENELKKKAKSSADT